MNSLPGVLHKPNMTALALDDLVPLRDPDIVAEQMEGR